MWYNNRLVNNVYAHVTSKNAHAVIDGVAGGWKRISPVSADGVSNVLDILKVAKANGRRVNVYIDSGNLIIAAVML